MAGTLRNTNTTQCYFLNNLPIHTPCEVIPLHVKGLSEFTGGVTFWAWGWVAVPMTTRVHSFNSAVNRGKNKAFEIIVYLTKTLLKLFKYDIKLTSNLKMEN